MKILNFIKRNLLGFIVGVIVATGVTTVALSVASKDVTYNNTNVESAINDLYSKVGSSGGELKTINLGSGTSFDIKNHPVLGKYYEDLTTDNFYYRLTSAVNFSHYFGETIRTIWFGTTIGSIEYNTADGILYVTAPTGQITSNSFSGTYGGTFSLDVYCNFVE